MSSKDHLIEILGTTTSYQNKVTIIKKVRDKYDIKEGDLLIWGINKNGDLILSKSESSEFGF